VLPADFKPIAGGSPEADAAPLSVAEESAASTDRVHPELTLIALVFGAAIVFVGVIPGPLFTFAAHAGAAITGLL
jgi:hypothetical protein